MESTPHSLPFTSETKPRQRCRHPEALKFHSTAVLAAAGPPDIPTAHWEGISLCFLLIHCIEQNLKLRQPTASFTFPLISPSLTHLNLAPNFCAEHQRVFNYKVVGHQGLLLIVCICVCVCVFACSPIGRRHTLNENSYRLSWRNRSLNAATEQREPEFY